VLAFIGNLSPLEIVVIGVVAILVFGKRLPEVAGRVLYHLRRLRQSMYDLRRETGIDQEIRNVERSMRKAAWEAETRAAQVIEAEETEEAGPGELPAAEERAPTEEALPSERARPDDAPPPVVDGEGAPGTTGPAST